MKTATEVLNDSFKRRKDENISAAGRLMITLEAMEEYASQFQPKWIKIESEEDLPKENGIYWTLRYMSTVPLYKEVFNDLDKSYWLKKYTYYMPILKPQLPKEE